MPDARRASLTVLKHEIALLWLNYLGKLTRAKKIYFQYLHLYIGVCAPTDYQHQI